MLGGFHLTYEGKEFVLGRNSTSKFIQLLQLVWLQEKEGVTKERLMQALYDRENLYNLNNSFYNLVYHMRKHMHRIGLPEADYITRKGGYYVTDEEIPVKIDALEFKSLVEAGDRETDEVKKARNYGQAFDLYKGELLPAISTELWVTSESLQYKTMFERCTSWLGEYLKKRKDYEAMYQVYARSSELYPFDDWQVYQIDALLCKGEYKDAFLLYDKTVHLYSNEIGLPPSDRMLECYEKMSQKIEYCPGDLTEIKDNIQQNAKKLAGGGVRGLLLFLPQLHRCLFPAETQHGADRAFHLPDALYGC